jgi:RimJ/RimL family protein N-acetyltransferase
MTAPAIDTERLTLRAHRADDHADVAAMWADPEVVRFIGGQAMTAEDVWSRLLRAIGHWQVLGFGTWVARERATGRFVGEIGFFDLRREIEPRLGHDPEAGWVLASWSHGRGFATEAMLAAHAWLGARRTVCIIDPDNASSLGVAAKCGYRDHGSATYRGSTLRVLERLP